MKEKNENKMNRNQMVVTGLVVVLVATLAFFGGIKFQQRKGPAIGSVRFGQNTQMPRGVQSGASGRQGQGFQPVMGEVSSVDGNTLTVKLSDGSSKIVILSESTTVSETTDGKKEDVKTGVKVAVFGTANSDGSVTAQNVQLNPQERMFAAPNAR